MLYLNPNIQQFAYDYIVSCITPKTQNADDYYAMSNFFFNVFIFFSYIIAFIFDVAMCILLDLVIIIFNQAICHMGFYIISLYIIVPHLRVHEILFDDALF